MPSYSGIKLEYNRAPVFHDSQSGRGRFIAAEMEIMGSDYAKANVINDTIARWQAAVVGDGSLPATGYEINTAPAKAEKFDEEIIDICRSLRNSSGRVNKSCGLHVHVDVRGVDILSLKRIIMTYMAVEEDVFSMLAPSRSNNGFCRKMKPNGWAERFHLNEETTAQQFQNYLETALYGRADPSNDYYKRAKGNSYRYNGLNIHSYFFRGTLEFRHHHGTANAVKIIAWARICESIIEFGLKNSEVNIKRFFNGNREPLASILSPTLKQYFLDRKASFADKARRKREREIARNARYAAEAQAMPGTLRY